VIWGRVIDVFRRRRLETDLDSQLAYHLDALEAEARAQGLSPDAARAAARRAMGGLTQVQDAYRDQLTIPVIDPLWQDVRYGCRVLARSPAFSVVAVAILAIGIASATTIFSFVDAVLLKPLPYENGDRIVRILERRPDGATSWFSTPAYLDWRANNTVFEQMAAQQQGLVTLTSAQDTAALRVARVTADYFKVFGIGAALGRTFAEDEDTPGKEHVVVLSDAIWRTQFGADARIVGSTIQLDNEPYTVIGVMPAGSAFDRGGAAFDRGGAQVWLPLAFRPLNMTWDYRWVNASFARLKPGVSLEAARAQMDTVGTRIATAYPNSNRGWGIAVERYADVIVGSQLRTSLLALMAAVCGLVLICCSNLASLVLMRAVSRGPEFAVRAAFGANRRRFIQQLLIEHAILTMVGSLLGIVCAYGSIRWLTLNVPSRLLPSEASVRLDARVLVFALAVSSVTAIVFGLVPALRGANLSLSGAMGTRSETPSVAKRRVLDALVVAEVAVAFVLLCGSALLIRSFVGLINVETGFVSSNVLTMNLPVPGFPPGSQFASSDEFKTYLRAIETAVGSIPGVQRVGLTNGLPLTDCCLYLLSMQVANRPVLDRANRNGGFIKIVTPSYFSALGLTLRQGRFLDARDIGSAVPVIVVNERLASRYFPNADAIGQHLLIPRVVPGKTEHGPEMSWEIVGVVANEKISALNDDDSAVVYESYEQSPAYFANLVVQAAVDPSALEPAVREALFTLNKGQAVLDVRTLEQRKSASAASGRVEAAVMSTFSIVAVVLAAVGMYGVLAYSIALRRREIGIRAALGASSSRLLRAVFGRGLVVTLIGLTIGIIVALVLAPLLGSVLYNVQTRDPLLMTLAATILVSVALLASSIPAHRAAHVDPIAVLRGD
jgi:putative ABC transport system permease protein